MSSPLVILLSIAAAQALLVLTPTSLAQRFVRPLRTLVTGLSATACLSALVGLLLFWTGIYSENELAIGLPGNASLLPATFQYDGQTALMIALVSFIGWVTSQYSIRYLEGEATQGRYFRWISFTIGCTSAMVLTGDMAAYCLLWCLTSLGLHQLLLHYPDRPAAQRAAWTKFIVSRIGDIALLIALALYTSLIPSLRFSQLWNAATDPAIVQHTTFHIATLALAAGVIAKSAQFPFHTWLPLTMETPTPVSALMHAGIVNAGGYLLVRSGSLLSAAPAAQLLVIIIGTITACLASIIMLTQTSIKKKLAYSTISQMGFMIMQCGLGAYSAAMLHILAHSLFKAHEFLSCGTVMVERAAMQSAVTPTRRPSWIALTAALAGLVAISWSLLQAVGVSLADKPGGWLLASILCMAMTHWLAQAIVVGRIPIIVRSIVTAVALLALYAVTFAAIDGLVATRATAVVAMPLQALVFVAFFALFAVQIALMSPTTSDRLRAWQIHAANGFYIESWLRRQLWRLSRNQSVA